MNNKQTIQQYINDVRRHLAPHLRPGIGLAFTVFPANTQGAILEIKLGPGITNSDEFRPESNTVNDALAKIHQRAFGGNLSGFKFAGTNGIMDDNRIVLIKGEDDPEQWNDSAADSDVKRILPPAPGGVR